MYRKILKYKTKEGVIKYRVSYKDLTSDYPKKILICYCTEEEFTSMVHYDGEVIQIIDWPKFNKEVIK